MSKQTNNDKLLHTVSRLQRDEILRYASNIGIEMDENLDDSRLQQAYAGWILAHPREMLTRLPLGDLKTLRGIRDHRDPQPQFFFNNYLTPIMVKYGLVDMEVVSDVHVRYRVPADFMEAVAPHLDEAMENEDNVIRMEMELITEGLANIFGYVNQTTIKKYVGRVQGIEDDEVLQSGFTYARQFSLLLDSMEWAENPEETPDEEVLFFSRYAHANAASVKQSIDQGSQGMSEPDFKVEEVVRAAAVSIPVIPNARGEEFARYLTRTFGMDRYDIEKLCFELWLYRQFISREMSQKALEIHYISVIISAGMRDLSADKIDEALQHMSDYMNALPLWQLWGNPALLSPDCIFKHELTGTPAMAKTLNKIRKNSRALTDFLNGDAIPSEKEMASILEMFLTELPQEKHAKKADASPSVPRVGRNDPCPCGSGLKYKKCHGR